MNCAVGAQRSAVNVTSAQYRGYLDFLNRFKPAQKPECFHFEQNSPNKVKLVQKNSIFWKTFKFW